MKLRTHCLNQILHDTRVNHPGNPTMLNMRGMSRLTAAWPKASPSPSTSLPIWRWRPWEWFQHVLSPWSLKRRRAPPHQTAWRTCARTKLASRSRPAPCTLAADAHPHRTTPRHLLIALDQSSDGCRGSAEACAGALASLSTGPWHLAQPLE